MKRLPRSWKRTLLMVLLLVTGGAIVNVAVAWTCALFSAMKSPAGIQRSSSPSLDDRSLIDKEWFEPESNILDFVLQQQQGFGVRIVQVGASEAIGGKNTYGPMRFVHIESTGLPFRSLQSIGYFGWRSSSDGALMKARAVSVSL